MTIEMTDVRVAVGSRVVVDDATLTLVPGEVIALVGASGSGKTTLLSCAGLLRAPTSGRILVDGVDATSWSDRSRQRFWREKAAFIYQDYGLVDEETVRYNVTLTPERRFGRRVRNVARVDECLSTVGLDGRAQDRVAVLSGGEKQRVGIARALYKSAAYIFADEPTASLDADNRHAVARLLAKAAADGACVVIATHDEELASYATATFEL